MNSLETTNVWLAILAIVSLIEFLMIVAAGVVGYKMYRRVTAIIENIERAHIAPVRARVDAILDEVQMMTAKFKHAQESVGDALEHFSGMGGVIGDAVKARAWPIRGIIAGVREAAGTLVNKKNGSKTADDPPVAKYGT
jgi:hypothetical protein